MITKEDKEYLLRTRLKVLEGLNNRKISQDVEVEDSIEDIQAKIQALTNMLEML
jgi:hypothetical protein